MVEPSPIFYLAMFTMSSVAVFAFWQYKSVEKSLQRSEIRSRRRQ